jgi:transposase InsO family protein
MDFVHDRPATGRSIRTLTIVDTFSRFSPAADARFNRRGTDVVLTLEQVYGANGCPATIRVNQCLEFGGRDLNPWDHVKGVIFDFSRPGRPTDTAFIEEFLDRFRSECLNAHWFMNPDDACTKVGGLALRLKGVLFAQRHQRAPVGISLNPQKFQLGLARNRVALQTGQKLQPQAAQRMGAKHTERRQNAYPGKK